MRKKYYIPNRSDFVVGFEYQVFVFGEWMDKKWTKFHDSGKDVFCTNRKERTSFKLQDMLDKELIRVPIIVQVGELEYTFDSLCGTEQSIAVKDIHLDGNYKNFIKHMKRDDRERN